MSKTLALRPPGGVGLPARTAKNRQNIAWQIGLVAALFALLVAVAMTLRDNLDKLGLSLGFDFLNRTAGFDIGVAFLPYSPQDSFWWAILVGAVNTAVLSLLAGLLATVLGVAVGLLRTSVNPLVRGLTLGYVELMRNTPILMQILLWSAVLLKLPPAASAWNWGGVILSQRGVFFPMLLPTEEGQPTFWACLAAALLAGGVFAVLLRRRFARSPGHPGAWRNGLLLPTVLGALAATVLAVAAAWLLGCVELSVPARRGFNFQGGMGLTPEFVAMLIAMTLYFGAFIAEIVRNGVESLPRGQWEASRALGMPEHAVMRSVVLPQTLRLILPPLIAQYVSLVKNSSLAIAIGYPDLFWSVFTVINVTGHAIEGVLILAAAYLTLTLGVSWVLNRWYAQLRRKG